MNTIQRAAGSMEMVRKKGAWERVARPSLGFSAMLMPPLGPLMMAVTSCQPKSRVASVDFATEIKPVFEAQCVNCHQSGALMGGLNLENRAVATRAQPHGQVIKPGDPDHSLIYSVLKLPETDKQAMPPGGHRI